MAKNETYIIDKKLAYFITFLLITNVIMLAIASWHFVMYSLLRSML